MRIKQTKHISIIQGENGGQATATAISRSFKAKSLDNNFYHNAIALAALFLDSTNQGDLVYGGQYTTGTTFWYTSGGTVAFTPKFDDLVVWAKEQKKRPIKRVLGLLEAG